MGENILLVIVGFFLLIRGADILVEGAVVIANKFRIPEIIVGLTLVSIGTSMPELMVSVTSAVANHADVAMGNVIGSNICNTLLILGVSSIARPMKFERETKLIEIPMTLVMIFTVFVLGNNGMADKVISGKEGVILIALFLCFIFYTITMAKYGNEFDGKVDLIKEDEPTMGIFKSILFILAGIVALKFGGDFVVNSACEIAEALGISEGIISLTIISLGTSLPELITSVTAAVKNNTDIAMGNVLGSNVFNFLLILGTSAVIVPVKYSVEYNIDLLILFTATTLLLLFSNLGKKNELTRIEGILFFIAYIVYIGTLFIR